MFIRVPTPLVSCNTIMSFFLYKINFVLSTLKCLRTFFFVKLFLTITISNVELWLIFYS
uniref:Uncharacterized protein n=1 Tax=Arundo donax TaxID=35708 RepID=A0A0A9HKN5_ARUDO